MYNTLTAIIGILLGIVIGNIPIAVLGLTCDKKEFLAFMEKMYDNHISH